MKTVIYTLLLLISFYSCTSHHTKQWEEVASIGNIKQGSIFQLIPLQDTTLILAGDEFSKISLKFDCVALKDLKSIQFKSAVSIPSFSGDISSFETLMNDEFEIWSMGAKSQNIEIPIRIIPLNGKYKGRGQVYLYLVDSNQNCISNIIAWNIKFK